MDFYKNNFKLNSEDAVIHNERYIRTLLKNNMLYKFISFTDNDELNNIKLKCIINDTVWMSHYNFFEDSTELKIPIDKYKVSQNTNRTLENIKF